MASSISSLQFISTSITNDSIPHGYVGGNFVFNHGVKKMDQMMGKESYSSRMKKFRFNCSINKDIEIESDGSMAKASTLVNYDFDVFEGIEANEENLKRGVKEPKMSTVLTNIYNDFDPYGAMSTPLYQTSTFKQSSATKYDAYDYSRGGNPTRDVLERLLAKIDKADRSLCFSSGMAALVAVTRLVAPGYEILAGDDMYGGSDRMLSQVIPHSGVVVKRVDSTNLEKVAAAIGPKTKLVWIETPTNPRQQICDIRKISEIAHEYGAIVMVDNSMMSSVLCQPLELGADVSMQSATKFITGHSDVMAGVLSIKGESLGKKLSFLQNAEGAGLAPFDCWLCLRGIKTMDLRVHKQQENAQKIAEYLSSHPLVEKVNYAGLLGHPSGSLHYSQAKGAGSVLSFTTGSLPLSQHIVENTKYFSITVSFGSVKSLISLPAFMSHSNISPEIRQATGLTDDLIRISVGIEDVDDLIADLSYALATGPL